jgi:hypothetical protein
MQVADRAQAARAGALSQARTRPSGSALCVMSLTTAIASAAAAST